MRFLDRKRVEIECLCGAKGVHLVADAYAQTPMACRICRRTIKLDERQTVEIKNHIEHALEAVLKEMSALRDR